MLVLDQESWCCPAGRQHALHGEHQSSYTVRREESRGDKRIEEEEGEEVKRYEEGRYVEGREEGIEEKGRGEDYY